MAHSKAISASDPQAIEKLTAKLQDCEKLQETMKFLNTYWRKHGTCVGAAGITAAQAEKYPQETQVPYGYSQWLRGKDLNL